MASTPFDKPTQSKLRSIDTTLPLPINPVAAPNFMKEPSTILEQTANNFTLLMFAKDWRARAFICTNKAYKANH